MLHWLIVIPYYFFSALTIFLLLVVVSRLVRSKATANTLATAAVVGGLLAVAGPLATEAVSIDDLGLVPMLVIAALSFALALIDALLKSSLVLPLDAELEEI
jgi:hypothetical protein